MPLGKELFPQTQDSSTLSPWWPNATFIYLKVWARELVFESAGIREEAMKDFYFDLHDLMAFG